MSIDGVIKHRLCLINTVLCVDPGCEKMLTEKVATEIDMLRRHLTILKYVVETEPIGILKLANETAIPSHKVRYSLRVLEHEGLIAASVPGAITTEETLPFIAELESRIDELVESAKKLKEIDFNR
jgi:predicted transcriptional regulator